MYCWQEAAGTGAGNNPFLGELGTGTGQLDSLLRNMASTMSANYV